MKIAIYSRKSKFTGKGESIENQIELCKDYIQIHLPETKSSDIDVFEEEGISGKATKNRPQFLKMMEGVKKQKYSHIVVYRLDRISRNVGDFSKLIEELNYCKVSFISIKEQFDTSTPMGRAMMNIAAVFSQLERETIAERVRDNMYMLARTGRWLGGIFPLGFNSTKEEYVNIDGKKRSAHKFKPLQEEVKLVRLIYSKFLEVQSLTGTEQYLMANEIKSRNNNYFTKKSLKNILTNPCYCTADKNSYEHFVELGCQVCCEVDEIDNTHGFIAYNRTSTGKSYQKENECSEWIIAVGKHKGIILSDDWIKASEILQRNRPLADRRKVRNPISLLSGLLVCGDCGHYMRPKPNSHYRAKGLDVFDYICEFKERSKKTKCSMDNADGNDIDSRVCEELFKYDIPDSMVDKQLKIAKLLAEGSVNNNNIARDVIENKIKDINEKISNLILSLSKNLNDSVLEYVNLEITKLDKQLETLKKESDKIEITSESISSAQKKYNEIANSLESFKERYNDLTIVEKRDLLHLIIEKVTWNKGHVDIFLSGCL